MKYLCRECLDVIDEAGDIMPHDGDQYCFQCKEWMARQASASMTRQVNLEEMGFTPDEVDALMEDWNKAKAVRILDCYPDGPGRWAA